MAGRSTRAKAVAAQSRTNVLTRNFRELPGDVALALSRVLVGDRQLDGISAKEVAIVVKHPLFGDSTSPFLRKAPIAVEGQDAVEIPWGAFEVEGLGTIKTEQDYFSFINGSLVLTAGNKVDLAKWNLICAAVVETLASTPGAFRGRALIVKDPDDVVTPVLVDVSKAVKPIFNDAVQETLETNVFRFIDGWRELKAAGESLKRGIILEGHYGTGKSTLAYQVAQRCLANGMTFLMVDGSLAVQGIKIAQILSPCWVFVEDIDASTNGNRDALNYLLNCLSGIESKDADIGLLVSTNFIERVDRAFLRPDRLDAIITLDLPDEATIGSLIEAFGASHLAEEDFSEVATYLKGATPAIISEVVRRARVEAICDKSKVSASRMLTFAKQMDRQRELAVPVLASGSNADNLVKALEKVVEERSNR